MRRSLLRFALLAAASFLACELLVRAVAPVLGPPLRFHTPVAQGKALHAERLDDQGVDHDVLFLGNSTVVEGVDVAVFESAACCGVQGYNGALNGATTYVMSRFAERFLLRPVQPRLVVYGLSPGSFSGRDDDQRALYDAAPATGPDDEEWYDQLGRHLALYRQRENLRDPDTVRTLAASLRHLEAGHGIVDRALDELDENGDRTERSSASLPSAPVVEPPPAPPAPVPAEAMDDLVRMRDAADSVGARIVLVAMPTYPESPQFVAAVRAVASELGFGYVDGTNTIDDAAMFVEPVHLNAAGAAAFSAWLAGELEPYLDG